MARPGPLERANRVAVGALTLPISLVHRAAAEPLLTGTVLAALTRAPVQYRTRLLKLLGDAGLSAERIALLIKSLKYLLAIGLVRKLNQTLNRLALNHWHVFRKPGAPFRWDRQTELVVVTGGCSGFGYEMVKGFSKHARVVILDISPVPEELRKLPGVDYYQVDLTDFSAIESIAETIRREHGDPTVLINNAGVANGTKIINSDAKLTDRIFKVNIGCHFILIKEFLPGMLRAKKGHVVTIASMASFYATPGLVDYCCTKVGALFLHEGLRSELRGYYENGRCIQTTSVHPSWHATGIVKPVAAKLEQLGIKCDPASNVSDAVVEQVLAGRSGQIFVPRTEEGRAGLRNWPLWLQDAVLHLQRRVQNFDVSWD
ncbi:uncharacterized protein Z519_10214 [Cladophialophora bantiana CBS 173.52]|uniref:Short-chain dehydrogenase/reductase 2 n=1 Tax=Cladophialophora bantiana (strain ATCC 10958 / CBS 173.52 / CDC B-1940 / NIH 8579) TaxID=1442370 RepID=A0A0D2HEY7_CLAB1|nr:uncharacterized protein Z519_10214 [Cladophialophora bantiana CBS 173.52]KIW89360.1 hypothetical protein Z519_10214 [Cladophialophora bantiana CBS 173.52]